MPPLLSLRRQFFCRGSAFYESAISSFPAVCKLPSPLTTLHISSATITTSSATVDNNEVNNKNSHATEWSVKTYNKSPLSTPLSSVIALPLRPPVDDQPTPDLTPTTLKSLPWSLGRRILSINREEIRFDVRRSSHS
ncbi:hypothetical protein CDAR_189561 [Caerostris darwini]|uniref:Uncharacterized protein n=1 Tax=Caerostris darwini TaxID=1538125 RepID=A0AAV4QSQ1_9ARAC|nr:hypothetical protein CDAR_189561 [Caerostris darwini]